MQQQEDGQFISSKQVAPELKQPEKDEMAAGPEATAKEEADVDSDNGSTNSRAEDQFQQ